MIGDEDELQALLHFLYSAPVVGLVQVNAEGRIELLNPQAARILLPLSASPGRLENLYDVLATAAPGLRALSPGRALPLELRGPSQTTEQALHAEITLHPLDKGRMMAVLLDVTELVQARREAESASRAKSAFLASTSHEIRTPLNAILGLAYVLERAGLEPEELVQVRQIAQAGRSLLALLNDVLDISKIEAGQLEIETLDVDLRDLVHDEVKLQQVALHGRPVRLGVAIDDAVPPLVRGDPTRLRQVLTNLLGNAVKFTPQGAIDVRVSAGSPGVVVTVADTGIGMSPQVQARLFTPFQQADVSTTRRFGGTGLGLAITAQLVGLMGGRITVRSAPGEGSAFTVELPLVPAHGSDSLLRDSDASPLRVLMADDDQTQLTLLQELGRALGWECRAVDGGRAARDEALAAANGQPFDALVLDWQMPDLDGLSVLGDLRAQLPASAWPAAVVVSQHELQALRAARHATLASALLVKPIDGSKLFNAVNQSVAALPERAARLLDKSEVGHSDLLWLADLRVLVVDDSAINLDVARKVLELEGARVTTCAGGREALALLNVDAGFDAALLDIQMPDVDGIELLRHLRGLPGCAELPAIALTAGVRRDDRDLAQAVGMTDFLPKPLEPRRLIRCLRRHVEARRGAPVPVQPRPMTSVPVGSPLPLGIDGIDDDAIAPSLRHDRPLVLSMIRHLLAEFGALGAEPVQNLPARLHKLRGSAGVLGAREVADAAQQVETALRGLVGLLDALRLSSRAALEAEDERLVHEQRALLGRDEAPLTPTELDELLHLIDMHDMRAVARAEALAARLLLMIGPDGLAELRAALEELDFDVARRVLGRAGLEG